jgi:hypothetical protein
MTRQDILDLYFMENRARLLEIASFLDRIDRARDAGELRDDPRYLCFTKALGLLLERGERTKAIQLSLSDPTCEPIASAKGLKAVGAWQGGKP